MCGICGIYGMRDTGKARQLTHRMTSALSHRGPDASGEFAEGDIAMGHTRLSVIDLDPVANQPMTDPTGRYTLVFNGEIYNFEALRNTLGPYPFTTRSDTEVLLAGLIDRGERFLKECRGMYAFAFWDRKEEQLLLARDPMGIKPLYYAMADNTLVFASEIRSILATGIFERKINRGALGEYLRFQTVHGTQTIVDGIFSLPAGSYLRTGESDWKVRYHYRRSRVYQPEIQNLPYAELKGLVREKLDTAVQRRMISDVPFGAFLSGGIDSSAIVALAASHATGPLKTFNIDFAEEKFSEARFARLVAERYNVDHSTLSLGADELLKQLPDALKAMDHPSGDGINTYVISGAAKNAGITVALSGLGGDELFAGYPIFKQFHRLQQQRWILSFPKFARNIAALVHERWKPGVASQKTRQVLNEDFFDLEYVYPYSRESSPEKINRKLLSFDTSADSSVFNIVHEAVGYGTPGFDLPVLSRVSVAEMSTYLESILLRDTDQMSMAHALEVRVPFLDTDLVSTVLSVGDSHKYPHTPKKLLVDSLGDLLPPEVTNRPKMGFVFPWEKWMKNELKTFCQDHLTNLGRRKEFNAAAIAKRWESFLRGDPKVTWSRLWHLCILEAWMEENGFR